MAITLTEAAAERVLQRMPNASTQSRLRLGVKQMGCTGFAYVMDYTEAVDAEDHEFESRGVSIVVDAKSLAAISGTEIDFRKEGLSESFQFANPNVKASCGCGESFSVD